MKVVFGSNDTADLSVIQSVCVSDAGGKVKILVRHKTKRTEKVSAINFRKKIHYNPDIEITKGFAEEIAEEIESLTQHLDLPINRVIDLKAWYIGCLGVDLNTATDAQATLALARLCWNWSVGRRNAPSDKELEQRTMLDTDTINRIAATDDYKQRVEDIMLNGSFFEPRTTEEFKAWIAEYGNMSMRFGKRMRLCEDDVQTLLESVTRQHGIARIRIA